MLDRLNQAPSSGSGRLARETRTIGGISRSTPAAGAQRTVRETRTIPTLGTPGTGPRVQQAPSGVRQGCAIVDNQMICAGSTATSWVQDFAISGSTTADKLPADARARYEVWRQEQEARQYAAGQEQRDREILAQCMSFGCAISSERLLSSAARDRLSEWRRKQEVGLREPDLITPWSLTKVREYTETAEGWATRTPWRGCHLTSAAISTGSPWVPKIRECSELRECRKNKYGALECRGGIKRNCGDYYCGG